MQGPIVMHPSKTCDRQDKLDQVLGKSSFLIHPAKALVAGIVLWLPLGLLSGRWVAMAWCCWSLVLLATALWLERPWLNRLPLPPITVLTLAGTIRWGLGAGLLVAAGDQVAPELKGWAQAVEPAQALWGIVSTAIVLAGLLNRPLLRRLDPAPPESGDGPSPTAAGAGGGMLHLLLPAGWHG